MREELDALAQAVKALERQMGSRSPGAESPAPTALSPDETERRLAEALASPKFTWVAFRGSHRWQRCRNQPYAMY